MCLFLCSIPKKEGIAFVRSTEQEPLLPQADVRQIEDYADQLYEDCIVDGVSDQGRWVPVALQDRMELKVYGAKCILRVCTEAG